MDQSRLGLCLMDGGLVSLRIMLPTFDLDLLSRITFGSLCFPELSLGCHCDYEPSCDYALREQDKIGLSQDISFTIYIRNISLSHSLFVVTCF